MKSKQRVADHGEVFTAEREVNAMCDLVADECLRIDSRFLEPACGEGNFLAEILKRKLSVVKAKYKKSAFDYERNAILALTSIYGVDIMSDNAQSCRDRLFEQWNREYSAVCKKEANDNARAAAKFILQKNIICGNALTLMCVDENQQDTDLPIIFSNWAFVTGSTMKREDYTFRELLQKEDNHTGPEQIGMDLTSSDSGEGTLIKIYPPVHYYRLQEQEENING